MKFKRIIIAACLLVFLQGAIFAQKKGVLSVSASINSAQGALMLDSNSQTGWKLSAADLQNDQFVMFTLFTPGDVKEIQLEAEGITSAELQKALSIYITYDPMNLGEPVKFDVKGNKNFTLTFPPKYGAHVRFAIKGNVLKKPLSIYEIGFVFVENATQMQSAKADQPWMNASLPVEERVELILAVMTPNDKMELLREGWGIPGIPHLGVPDIKKVEAVHGFSYGSGATIFPIALAMGATFNKELTEKSAAVIGVETLDAGAIQAWSPVLDVARDPRWGRCEESYGECPVLVSMIGGAWIKGYQSQGLMTTPKHFGVHGAPLGGRDSHDIDLSEREIREIHHVPFRHVIREYDCQSLMMSYNGYFGVPVAKNRKLLHNILREEWGFNGFIVSDCGAIGNLTSRKHYTALDYVEAANQALRAGIATNCGDVYNHPEVIKAANDGRLNMEHLDNTCRTLLAVMFRNGLFENNPSRSLDWDKIYPTWQSPEHLEVAREAARQSMVLLENKNDILPLSKSTKTIAVIGPGADNSQPGGYSPKLREGQMKSVLTGIKAAVDKNTKVIFEKGCEFTSENNYNGAKAKAAAAQADVVVMVLGDMSEREPDNFITIGENHDYATLELPGRQLELLKDVVATGKPVILVLQVGRPYNISYAAENCAAILVKWLSGQEGGLATADILFGDYNPAGRLPMTFPRHVGQVPNFYNFKTSGRRYEYSDMEFYPLYSFGFGLSYTKFQYSNLQTKVNADGGITASADVKNIGSRKGDEVVQLYVTDMYASVMTRVMELKDFDRITLNPGESKNVSFTLSPYQISLLNDKMDRVVEPGDFRIMIGGTSPSFRANDRIKDSLKYPSDLQGVSDMLDYPNAYAADFTVDYVGIEENLIHNRLRANIRVKNVGNIMDIGKAYMYVNGVRAEEVPHYELAPGEERIISFDLFDEQDTIKELVFATKYKTITINL
jgi:beta-glucosidase